MYEQFYNVRTNPFALTPDPEYLFLSDEQREAIAGLMYAVLARRGFSVLIGDAGTGKTTLLRAMMRSLPEARAVFSVVVNPTLNPAEFLRTCVGDFGIDTEESAKDTLLTKLHKFLLEAHKQNKVAVLIIDEAQRLSPQLLEEVRLLTNFETDKEKLIQVILAGQDELADILDRHELRQLKQRVSTRLHIKPLTPGATSAYMRYRWARCSDAPLPFDESAIAAIQDISTGIPRLINSICENSLILGFAQGLRTIDQTVINNVAADPHLIRSRKNIPLTPPIHDTRLVTNTLTTVAPDRSNRNDQDEAMLAQQSRQQASPQIVLSTLDRYTPPRRGWRVLFGLD